VIGALFYNEMLLVVSTLQKIRHFGQLKMNSFFAKVSNMRTYIICCHNAQEVMAKVTTKVTCGFTDAMFASVNAPLVVTYVLTSSKLTDFFPLTSNI
jgi:hypothetical protein